MKIVHVSAECYPMAKVGGLADVVGSLPKYQHALGHSAMVIMPMHQTPFLSSHEWELIQESSIPFSNTTLNYSVIKEKNNNLHFELYCINVVGFFDRPNVYGYDDDTDRFLAFQIATMNWLSKWENLPDLIHVHDHHAGLIPFMLRHCYEFQHLSTIKTVLTIHNAQYQGWMPLQKADYLPSWDKWKSGLLEWDHQLNPLACAIKCADKVTTVSPSYMQELVNDSNGLAYLFKNEKGKCSGIINGIDYEVWDPKTDHFIEAKFNVRNLEKGKRLNKEKICTEFNFDTQLPLFIFIGRFVTEKAADLLPDAISRAFEQFYGKFNMLILGNGDPLIEQALSNMHQKWFGYYHSKIAYNETLSHQMYAGADFLLMPSRVEPCGLNQLYALRYGTIPIVRSTGGLKDTVIDFGNDDGFGICFNQATVDDIVLSIGRALDLYNDNHKVNQIRKKMISINNSWESSAKDYIHLYNSI